MKWPARPGARAVGLDWSGSLQAGRKIWEAHVTVEKKGIRVERLDRPFAERTTPNDVRDAFPRWFERLDADVLGFDFCFGLERSHARLLCDAAGVAMGDTMQPARIGRIVAMLCPTAEELRTRCGAERKRETDRVVGAPFAPTNLRMYRQTWLGLTCLATIPRARIAPWATSPGPVILEVLPASVARALGFPRGYKGRGASAAEVRTRLIRCLEGIVALRSAHRREMLADAEGDAIDAVLAALAALRAHQGGFASPGAAVLDEGWTY